jgi:hypothetical protein
LPCAQIVHELDRVTTVPAANQPYDDQIRIRLQSRPHAAGILRATLAVAMLSALQWLKA